MIITPSSINLTFNIVFLFFFFFFIQPRTCYFAIDVIQDFVEVKVSQVGITVERLCYAKLTESPCLDNNYAE